MLDMQMARKARSIALCGAFSAVAAGAIRLLSLFLDLHWPLQLAPYLTGGIPLLCTVVLGSVLNHRKQHKSLLRRMSGAAVVLMTFSPVAHFYIWGLETGSTIVFTTDQAIDEEVAQLGWRDAIGVALRQLPAFLLLGAGLWLGLGTWRWLPLIVLWAVSSCLYSYLWEWGRWGQAAALIAWFGALGAQIGAWVVEADGSGE